VHEFGEEPEAAPRLGKKVCGTAFLGILAFCSSKLGNLPETHFIPFFTKRLNMWENEMLV